MIECLKHMTDRQRTEILRCLCSDEIETNHEQSIDEMLTWDQVSEMGRGGIDFGAHTMTHPLLPYEDDAAVQEELREAKRVVEERLKKRVRGFAYPNGNWDARVRERVQQSGYDFAFTTQG